MADLRGVEGRKKEKKVELTSGCWPIIGTRAGRISPDSIWATPPGSQIKPIMSALLLTSDPPFGHGILPTASGRRGGLRQAGTLDVDLSPSPSLYMANLLQPSA